MERFKFSPSLHRDLFDVNKNLNIRYKILDTHYQRDWHGGPDFRCSSMHCVLSIEVMGRKKTCRRCKRVFYTGTWRSRVICLDCKEELKKHPKHYEKICPICHIPYKSTRSDAQTCRKDSCRKKFYRMNQTEKMKPNKNI